MMTLQEHYDERAARYAEPDFTPQSNPFDIHRRLWTRTHRMSCHFCGREFYGYEPQNEPFPPFDNPGMPPPISNGRRQTCGHPLCRGAEELACLANDPAYCAAQQKPAFDAPKPENKPKTRGGLTRIG